MGIIRLSGYLDVPLHRLAQVSEALPEHISLTHEEDGCIKFSVAPCPDVDGRFLVSEAFISQDAFDAHQMRTHKSDWAKITDGIERHFTITEDA